MALHSAANDTPEIRALSPILTFGARLAVTFIRSHVRSETISWFELCIFSDSLVRIIWLVQFRLSSLFSLRLYVIYAVTYLSVIILMCYCFLVAYICSVWLSRFVGGPICWWPVRWRGRSASTLRRTVAPVRQLVTFFSLSSTLWVFDYHFYFSIWV